MTFISKSRKIIFIHLYKNAGSSIKRSLESSFVHSSNDPDLLKVIKRKLFYSKLRILYGAKSHTILSDLSPSLDLFKFFSFCVVRNPWDREFSLYRYILTSRVHFLHDQVVNLGSFSSFLDWRLSSMQCQTQTSFVELNGKIAVNRVLRYENLESEFSALSHELGFKSGLKVYNKTPDISKSIQSSSDYRDFYNAKDRQLVADAFRDDVSNFDYHF